MEVYIILALVAVFAMLFVGYWLGGKVKAGAASQMVENLQAQLAQHIENEKRLEQTVQAQTAQMASLTSERDVQKAHTENYCRQLAEQKENAEKLLADQKAEFERQLSEQKAAAAEAAQLEAKHNEETLADMRKAYDEQLKMLRQMNKEQVESQLQLIKDQMLTTSEEVLKRQIGRAHV